MAERDDIMKSSVGLDYSRYATGSLAFDYERLLADTGYDIDSTHRIQSQTAVGNTPVIELHNVTKLIRVAAKPGKGARVFVKDEAVRVPSQSATVEGDEGQWLGLAGPSVAKEALPISS